MIPLLRQTVGFLHSSHHIPCQSGKNIPFTFPLPPFLPPSLPCSCQSISPLSHPQIFFFPSRCHVCTAAVFTPVFFYKLLHPPEENANPYSWGDCWTMSLIIGMMLGFFLALYYIPLKQPPPLMWLLWIPKNRCIPFFFIPSPSPTLHSMHSVVCRLNLAHPFPFLPSPFTGTSCFLLLDFSPTKGIRADSTLMISHWEHICMLQQQNEQRMTKREKNAIRKTHETVIEGTSLVLVLKINTIYTTWSKVSGLDQTDFFFQLSWNKYGIKLWSSWTRWFIFLFF